jgi:RimJ/RimL family protein N-acetyltransferase
MSSFWRRHRDRIDQWGVARTLEYYLFAVAPDKLGIKFLSAYEYTAQSQALPATSQVTFDMWNSFDDCRGRDAEILKQYFSEDESRLFREFFGRGDTCAVARCTNEEIACLCWIEETTNYCFERGNRAFVIHNCFTLPPHRGKGLYPQTLSYACRYLQRNANRPNGVPVRIFVDCAIANFASKRGIEKAGFARLGKIITAFNRSWRLTSRLYAKPQRHDAYSTS